MIRIIAIYGSIAGLVVAIPMVWLMMLLDEQSAPDNGALYGYLTMIVALTTVFLGIKHYRDRVLGGVVKFVPALLLGLGISALASLIYAVGWEISLAYSGFDFGDAYARMATEAARSSGASEAQVQQAAAQAEAFKRMYSNPLYRVPITFVEMFPIGVLISVLSAALLRNSRFLTARP